MRDNSLSERVAAVAEVLISHLTSEFASGQIVLGMNARDALLCHKRPDNPGSGMISENHRITCWASQQVGE